MLLETKNVALQGNFVFLQKHSAWVQPLKTFHNVSLLLLKLYIGNSNACFQVQPEDIPSTNASLLN